MGPNLSIFLGALRATAAKSYNASHAELPEILPDKKQVEELQKLAETIISRWEFYESRKSAKKSQKKNKK